MKKSKKNELRYNEDDERTLLEDILGFIKVFVVSAIVILLFVNFVSHPVRVDGRSMYPTLKDGEFGFTNVGGVLLNGVERGDIVVVTMEEEGQKTHWVKRVIGLPGDTVSCVNDVVYIKSNRGIIPQKTLAEKYGVKQCTISAIQCGRIWKEVMPNVKS